VRATVLSLVSYVATGYLELLELDQERAVAERTLSSRQATLDLARRRFGRGLISELDVRQFEAQVAVPAARLARSSSCVRRRSTRSTCCSAKVRWRSRAAARWRRPPAA